MKSKSLVEKIQNFAVNHETRLVESNSGAALKKFVIFTGITSDGVFR